MKLNKGTTVCHLGKKYKNKCPDEVAKAVGLKDVDTPKPKRKLNLDN